MAEGGFGGLMRGGLTSVYCISINKSLTFDFSSREYVKDVPSELPSRNSKGNIRNSLLGINGNCYTCINCIIAIANLQQYYTNMLLN